MTIRAVNPATGETINEYQEMTPEEVKSIIENAHEAFLGWRKTSFAERTGLMKNAAQMLRNNAEVYAKLMAQEMGKPITGGRGEAKSAPGCATTMPITPRSFCSLKGARQMQVRALLRFNRWALCSQ